MQAIVLGSGMSAFVKHFDIIEQIPYEEFVPFPYDPIEGHERILYLASYKERRFIILSGRFHLYEGLSPNEVNYAIDYVIKKYKVDQVLLCSASGALSQDINLGSWYQINSFICFPQVPHLQYYKPQSTIASLEKCTYAYHQGPSLGTNAEYKMLNSMGAALIGMSLYPEVQHLSHKGLIVECISLAVCQYEPFSNTTEPSHKEVVRIAHLAVPTLVFTFKKMIQ